MEIVTADRAPWDDLAAVFGTRGTGARCWCQRYKLAPRETFAGTPAEERAWRLREQAGCDDPGSPSSGLVAYDDDGTPVGWCAVEPRPAYTGLVRVGKVPWEGRDEDRTDASVWAVTCLFVRAGHRRRGTSRALAVAAVGHARTTGARALEAYPITTTSVIAEELHVGTVPTFEAAGLEVVHRPTPRRVVMRIELG
ncbi:GNAT family N-acetyltransferase [Nocardioides sp. SYSU D00038]|uniref:GNAT family N-acetyltransferase n=1 Tax=Nocardioides sp. SYSU D00038 TaxID=2812554 RepID=UPI001967DAAF|nr:GNAT family N-acetyltransferase [Nocardioides sp. SYSU D00038]